MKLFAATALGAALLSGCSGTGAVTDLNGCDWTAYILASNDDVLTEGTAAQIENHNLIRQKTCEGKI